MSVFWMAIAAGSAGILIGVFSMRSYAAWAFRSATRKLNESTQQLHEANRTYREATQVQSETLKLVKEDTERMKRVLEAVRRERAKS